MSGGIWYTSDTHFGHKRVAEIRGFATKEEHDEEVIRRWNSVVRPDDIVWHLGDVGFGNEKRILETVDRLNGRKQLVAGNHDDCWPGHSDAWKHQMPWMMAFDSVQAFAKRKINGRLVLMSHFPYTGDHAETERYSEFRLRESGLPLLHGHTHQPWPYFYTSASNLIPYSTTEISVGLDAWNLTPVNEGEIGRLLGD